MTFLPIVDRELRESARRKSTRRIRLIVAAVALLIGLFQLALMPIFMGIGRMSGGASFAFMTGYAYMLCLLAGVFVTADSLSEEKREGTLGLLFLTDLRGYDVVLGKLAAQLVHLGYALLAIIPAAALPLLLGGVTGGELWRICLALGNLLFFSLAAGMLASALCRQAGRAMMLAGTILTLLCLVLPMLQGINAMLGANQAGEWFLWFSPSSAYGWAHESSFASQSRNFWSSLGASHLLAWLMIIWASWWLPHSWQDKPMAAGNPPPVAVGPMGAPVQARRRKALLDNEPLLWLIGERPGLKLFLWSIAAFWSATTLCFAILQMTDSIWVIFIVGLAGLVVAKMLFAAQACRFFVETRQTGSFELLLAAPINSRQIISAQWLALRRLFGPPLLLALGSTVVSATVLAVAQGGSDMANTGFFAIFGGGFTMWIIVAEVLDFFALGWLGMWLALTMRKPHLATGATILIVLISPWIVTCYAPFIGFVLDIILIAIFATKLRGDFRYLIMERPAFTRIGRS